MLSHAHHDPTVSITGANVDDGFPLDPALAQATEPLFDQEFEDIQQDLDEATASAITATLAEAHAQEAEEQARAEAEAAAAVAAAAAANEDDDDDVKDDEDGVQGGGGAVSQPTVHSAPFNRPKRGEDTPCPELYVFANKAEFNVWLEGESSWCHYVQRRNTNPDKRAEERLRARQKAHAAKIAALPPDEAASASPLKKRRRNRVSPVKEKLTYTCHHAGTYSSKHSTTLPPDKLRMNTKKSVKCGCRSRIVMNEFEDGECKVTYFWRHEGHDPFAENIPEAGKLPKIIDEWLVQQVVDGKDTEAIMRSLQLSEEEKDRLTKLAEEDPTSYPVDQPPPLIFNYKIKYPDVYNRYRKLKGPIKGPRNKSRQATGSQAAITPRPDGEPSSATDGYVTVGEPTLNDPTVQHVAQVDDESQQYVHPDGTAGETYVADTGDMTMMDFHQIGEEMTEELAKFAAEHGDNADLAKALLELPQQEGNEELLRMARAAEGKGGWSV